MSTLKYLSPFIVAMLFMACDNTTSSETAPKEHTSRMRLLNSKNVTFQMGSENGDDSEKPVHNVTFTYDYYIDTTEVTQKEFLDIINNSQYGFPEFKQPVWSEDVGIGDNYPMHSVSWYDAILFCNTLSKIEGLDTVYSYDSISIFDSVTANKIYANSILYNVSINTERIGYRLPTEAEWEFACRAGTTTDWYWGNDTTEDTVKNYCWYRFNANDYFWTQPHAEYNGLQPVAQKQPNAWGLYDMSGNAWEWCNDYYSSSYYDQGDITDPFGPDSSAFGIMRGGLWKMGIEYASSYYRYPYLIDTGGDHNGFRVVLPVY